MDSSTPSAPPSFRRALQSRPFFLVWLSQLISQSGDFVFEVALLWLVLEVTGSVFAVGLVVAVTLVPAVVLGPFLGVYVDRWDRRKILVATNVGEGVAVASLSGLVLAHAVDLDLVLFIVFVLGTGSLLVRSASGAMIPQLVRREDLAPANSLLTFSSSLNQVIGLSVGGVVVALFGVTLPIEYDAVSFFAAALIVLGVSSLVGRPDDATPGVVARFSEEFVEGLRFIRANWFLVELIVLAAILNFFGLAAIALFAPYAKLVLHGGAPTYGFLGASVAIGTIIGAAIVGKLDTRRSTGKYLLGGAAAIGAAILGLGLTNSVPLALGVALALGVVLSITNIPISVLLQAKVPGRLRGRVGAAAGSLIIVTGPVGAAFAGSFADATSVATVFVVTGIAFLVGILIATVVMTDLRKVSY
jgi:MFS transporter, DHA3 family, macrolide efflux protein